MSVDESGAKRKILDTAVLLFSENGYKETSVRDLSKEAGVNVSMISYYFGKKEGLLETIVSNITEGFSSYLDQLDLDNPETLHSIIEEFLHYLETHRAEIKILLFEIGKNYDYLLPIKNKITELQTKLGTILIHNVESDNLSLLTRKIQILTDIILGMVFSDYIFDFSSFQDGLGEEDKRIWREERMEMLIKMFRQFSGIDSGQFSFDSIF